MEEQDPVAEWWDRLEDVLYRFGERLGEAWAWAKRSGVLQAAGVGALGVIAGKGLEAMSTKKVFISFAIEDKWARERLRGQSLNTRTPFEFRDMSLNEPFSEKWKTQCREVIKGCDGVIAFLSKETATADGARWEMRCAVEEGIPIIGVHADRNNKGTIPPELADKKVIEWNWEGITSFIDRCSE